MFQQKLEDEVRKDQQEKRDHQEMLKILKGDIKELVDFQERWDVQISVNDAYSGYKKVHISLLNWQVLVRLKKLN